MAVDPGGTEPHRRLRIYDHRLVQLLRETGDPTIATRFGVPRSTAAGWIRRGPRTVTALAADPCSACNESSPQRLTPTEVATIVALVTATDDRHVPTSRLAVLADAGVENKNGPVDALIASGLLKRLLAQTEIRFSNSMIEAWWRCLKHQWLYLHPLDSMAKVRSLVEFHVAEHHSRVPHCAFRGQTPDEMDLGTGAAVPDQLAEARRVARSARLAANRALRCAACA